MSPPEHHPQPCWAAQSSQESLVEILLRAEDEAQSYLLDVSPENNHWENAAAP